MILLSAIYNRPIATIFKSDTTNDTTFTEVVNKEWYQ